MFTYLVRVPFLTSIAVDYGYPLSWAWVEMGQHLDENYDGHCFLFLLPSSFFAKRWNDESLLQPVARGKYFKIWIIAEKFRAMWNKTMIVNHTLFGVSMIFLSRTSPECSATGMGQFPICKLEWDLLRTSVTACTIDENTFSAPSGIF